MAFNFEEYLVCREIAKSLCWNLLFFHKNEKLNKKQFLLEQSLCGQEKEFRFLYPRAFYMIIYFIYLIRKNQLSNKCFFLIRYYELFVKDNIF